MNITVDRRVSLGRGADTGPVHRSVLSQSTLRQAGLWLKTQGAERAKMREVN